MFELQWGGDVPGGRDLRRLAEVWSGIDYDAPTLSEEGSRDVWRKPLLHPAVCVAVLHALGWPCRWRAVPDVDALEASVPWDAAWVDWDEVVQAALDERPWWSSNPERLRSVPGWAVPLLRGYSRSVDRLLPPPGPFPAEGRRRFGSRRGVRRLRPQNLAG